MRFLRKALFRLGVIAFLLGGACLLYLAWQLSLVTGAAQAAPKPIKLADLIAKGAGDNLHVEVTDFTFGKPVFEKEGQPQQGVWLPIAPAGEEAEAVEPAAVLRANGLRDQAGLDALLKQTKLQVLATKSLPVTSLFKVRVSKALRRTYPNLDTAKVTFLTEPALYQDGEAYLSAEQIFNPTLGTILWGAGGVLCLLGVVGLFLVFLRSKGAPEGPPGQALPVDPKAKERLAIETPLSTHGFKVSAAMGPMFSMGCAAVILLTIGAVIMVSIVKGPKNPSPNTTPFTPIMVGIIGMLFFLGAGACIMGAVKAVCPVANEIAICPSGLRWQKGDKRWSTLWTEIDHVFRYHNIRVWRGRVYTTDYTILYFLDGKSLKFIYTQWTDYPRFAKMVAEMHQMETRQIKFNALNQVYQAGMLGGRSSRAAER